jgi:RNA polymerase sigma-70 factor (ECF subfamily)
VDRVLVLPVKGNAPDSELISLRDRDDDALMLMARAGVHRAFEILVRRHQRMALGTAIKYLGNRLLAEDIAQNSFMDLFRCLASYRPEGKFRSFFATIVINNCRMANRRERSEAAMREGLFPLGLRTEPTVSDDGELERREEQRLLDATLLTLSPKLREVLVLRFAAGLSHQQIAEALRIRIGTVKSRLFAGMAKLSQALEVIRR